MAQENLTDVINKRFSDSLLIFKRLVDPVRRYEIDLETSKAWSRLTLNEQRKLYLYILYRKWRGLDIFGEPYAIIRNCHPVPFNWNGQNMLNSLLRSQTKMVSAKYNGAFGIYTLDEAKLYDMTIVKKLN